MLSSSGITKAIIWDQFEAIHEYYCMDLGTDRLSIFVVESTH